MLCSNVVSGKEDAGEEHEKLTQPPEYKESASASAGGTTPNTNGDKAKDKLIQAETAEKGRVSLLRHLQ